MVAALIMGAAIRPRPVGVKIFPSFRGECDARREDVLDVGNHGDLDVADLVAIEARRLLVGDGCARRLTPALATHSAALRPPTTAIR